jgi:hypothetical protein
VAEERGVLSVGRRRARRFVAAVGVVSVALLGVTSSAWGIEATHVFDPALSLRGDCGADQLDAKPDPGCPYPPPPVGPETFNPPARAAVDQEGDIYVLDGEDLFGPNQRIYVFDSSGHWLFTETKTHLLEKLGKTYPELSDPERALIEDVEVDSEGHLYISVFLDPRIASEGSVVVRYSPSSYPPDAETEYVSPHLVVGPESGSNLSLAVDSNDRLYVDFGNEIGVYGSAEEGNESIRSGIGLGVLSNSSNVAVGPAPAFDVYASGLKPGAHPIPSSSEPFVSEVYEFEGLGGSEPGNLEGTIDGSNTDNCATVGGGTECGFGAPFGGLDVAVDLANSDVYVSDKASKAVYQFRRAGGSGEYFLLSKITHSFENTGLQAIALGNGPSNPDAAYLFVTSRSTGVGHLYAFKPHTVGSPIVARQGVSGLSTNEATLTAEVNPGGAAVRYDFEYVDETTFLKDIQEAGPGHGFDDAHKAPIPAATIGEADALIPVSWPLTGLQPGTVYRFRAVAENCDASEPERESCITRGEGNPGGDGEGARFATYPSAANPAQCPNEAFRAGRSATLPDCRAYELVTLPDTNGLTPGAFTIGGAGVSSTWSAPLASPDGESALFVTIGGSLPGLGGSGALNSDGYRSRRDPTSGWHTEAAGPSGKETEGPAPGGFSSDQNYWAWTFLSEPQRSIPQEDKVGRPDGSFELVGQGSLLAGGDREAKPRWITDGGTHLIFTSRVRLEQGAPPAGTEAIYDRPVGSGAAQVISLLPGERIPNAGENAIYQGASGDGSAVAFTLGDTLYVRTNEAQTLEVTGEEAIFAGFSRDGSRLFYLHPTAPASGMEPARGDLFMFDTTTGTTTRIGTGGKSIPVNVAADGAVVYFVSTEQLADGAEAGEDNLYRWDAGTQSIHFIAALEHSDVTGEDSGSGKVVGGLGLWTTAVGPNQDQFHGRSSDPSRSTPSGDVLAFESHGDLTGRNSIGVREIYRYDAAGETLTCVSCDPTLVQPPASAKLVRLFEEGGELNPLAEVANLSDDGKRVFFESPTPLVPTDVNGTWDVYEWRGQGLDSCGSPDGCVALISSGQSSSTSVLWGASADGRDVFVRTNDILLPRDMSETASIYDARIGGGFPEGESTACEGEACRQQGSPPPSLPSAGSETFHSGGNTGRSCPKARHKLRRAGRQGRCTKQHRHRRHAAHRRRTRR